jgi:hypothetical protein
MISLLKEYFSKSQTILLPILLTAIASPLLWENLGVTAFAVVTPPPWPRTIPGMNFPLIIP